MQKKTSKGFTLIELLAVILILGIIFSIVTMQVMNSIKKSEENTRFLAAQEIINMAEAYMASNNTSEAAVKTMIEEGYLEEDATNPLTGQNDLYKYLTDSEDNQMVVFKDDKLIMQDFDCVNCIDLSSISKLVGNALGDKIKLSVETRIRMFDNYIIVYTKQKVQNVRNFIKQIKEETNKKIIYNMGKDEYIVVPEDFTINEEDKQTTTKKVTTKTKTTNTTTIKNNTTVKNTTTKKATTTTKKTTTTVNNVLATSIKVSGTDTYGILKGETTTLKVEFTPTNTTNKDIKWSSSDKNIATVDNKGVVTGKGKGIATITATTTNSKKATYNVYVSEKGSSITFLNSLATGTTGASDAILLKDDNHYAMIDVGTRCNYSYIKSYLKKHGVKKLTFLLITHPDHDHIGGTKSEDSNCAPFEENGKNISTTTGGAKLIIQNFEPNILYVKDFNNSGKFSQLKTEIEKVNGKYVDLYKLVNSEKLKPGNGTNDSGDTATKVNIRVCYKSNGDIKFQQSGDTDEEKCNHFKGSSKLKFSGFADWNFHVYNVNDYGNSSGNVNNKQSIVTEVRYNYSSSKSYKIALFADFSVPRNSLIAERIGNVDIFKAPHHGISTNYSDAQKTAASTTLEKLKPEYIVVNHSETSSQISNYKNIVKTYKDNQKIKSSLIRYTGGNSQTYKFTSKGISVSSEN